MTRPAYDVVFPPRGRQQLDGGLDNKFERSLINDNESPDCFNVVFTNGAATTRQGSSKLNTTAIGAFTIDGLYTRHDNSGSETMVAFAGGSAWQLGVTTFTTIPSAQSVFTAGVRVACAEQENYLFACNGSVTPAKYNGTYWTRHGVPAPSTSATVASNGAGNLAGDYRWKVTYVNSASVEGNVSPATATFTVTSTGGQVTPSNIPTAPQSHGVNSRRIYRTNAGGSTFFRIGTIADNTTTTFSDNVASSAVGTTAPTDNGEPPNYSVIVQHQGRLFCNDAANPNFVWYSEALAPYTFASVNFQAFGDKSLDLVRGLQVFDNSIIVQGDKSIFFWYMPNATPSNWVVIKIASPYGSKSPFGAFSFNNKLMVPAMQSGKFVGFAAVNGNTIDPVDSTLDRSRAGSDMQSDRIEPDMFNVQEGYLGNISAMVFKQKAYISLTYGSNQTANNRVYIYDFSRQNLVHTQGEGAWSPVSGINASQFTVYGGALYYGSSTATGFVYQLESSTYTDDGTAIDSYIWTKEFAGNPGHENLQKDFRFLRILVDMPGSYFMNVTFRTDSDSGTGITKQVSLDSGSAVWGQFLWGNANWGSGSTQKEITIPIGLTGKRIQFKFSNQNAASQRFKVHGLNFTYNIKGKR